MVGLDVHPDSFAGAVLEGSDPLRARVLRTATRLGLPLLEKWATNQSKEEDVWVARKLCVAVWHLLQGHPIGALERLDTLHTKLHRLATELGLATIKAEGYLSKEAYVQKKLYLLKSYP